MKKVIFTLFVFVLMLFLCAMTTSAIVRPYRCGDADCNDSINVKDATLIQKFVADIEGLGEYAYLLSDTDGDGGVTVKDATIIQKYVAGLDISAVAADNFGEEIYYGGLPTLPPETEIPSEPTNPTEPVVEKMDTNITIYFSNNQKWTKVNAYLYNESAGTQNAEWPGVAMKLHTTNSYGEQIYMLEVDVSEYNRVVFNNGTSQSMNASLSVASSGFYIAKNTPKSAMPLGVYAFDVAYNGKQTTVTLDYPDGYKKPITIVTPNGYDPEDTSKTYPVIYLLDGQNQFLGTNNGYGGWVTDKIATSLQSNGHDGFILVGIDNSRNRDNELTPDIGDVVSPYNKQGFENGTGDRFSKFVANDVMTYIQENYNASKKPEDNAIIGASSGGIEAFYIGMENMDKFGRIGALSPAFMLFDKSDWDTFLGKFDFSDASKLPRIYFYNGGGDSLEKELNPYAKAMPQWMAGMGYPEDKMIFVHEDTFSHNEYAWRMIMPEALAWLFDLQ